MELNGGSSAPYLACTPCVPLFCTLFSRDGNRRAFSLPGAGGGSFPLCGGTFARSYSVSKKTSVEHLPSLFKSGTDSWQDLTPKTFSCTARSPFLGSFPRCETGFGRCERLFWDSRPEGPKWLLALSVSTFRHFGCFDTCTRATDSWQDLVSKRVLRYNWAPSLRFGPEDEFWESFPCCLLCWSSFCLLPVLAELQRQCSAAPRRRTTRTASRMDTGWELQEF